MSLVFRKVINATEELALASKFPDVRIFQAALEQSDEELIDLARVEVPWSRPTAGMEYGLKHKRYLLHSCFILRVLSNLFLSPEESEKLLVKCMHKIPFPEEISSCSCCLFVFIVQELLGGKNFSHFSAVCWLFGRYLYKTLKYPIGLVHSSWGGTPVEAWSSPRALHKCGLMKRYNAIT